MPSLKRATVRSGSTDFESLVGTIVGIHEQLKFRAARAVDVSLTLRNWLIGRHIREYEQEGRDRASYGEKLLSTLAERLTGKGVSNCSRRQLYRYRDFYRAFPEIVGTASPQSPLVALPGVTTPAAKVGTPSPKSRRTSPDLLGRLSYSHFEELTELTDPLKRAFYLAECLRGCWSVRELKRQTGSLYYERTGLSRSKKKLSEAPQAKAEPQAAAQVIREPYVSEFLGLFNSYASWYRDHGTRATEELVVCEGAEGPKGTHKPDGTRLPSECGGR